ncbi:hypothetical protein FHX06_006815 [Rhizobium sp. BK512]|nr:hypothetical protein [Rhizobium sp. BK512]
MRQAPGLGLVFVLGGEPQYSRRTHGEAASEKAALGA